MSKDYVAVFIGLLHILGKLDFKTYLYSVFSVLVILEHGPQMWYTWHVGTNKAAASRGP